MSPNKLRVELGSGVRVYTTNQAVREEMRKVLTHANPSHTYAEKFSPYGYTSVDPEIRLYEETDEYFKFPRGVEFGSFPPAIREQLKKAAVKDMRVYVPAQFPDPVLPPSPEQVDLIDAVRTTMTTTRPRGNFMLVASTATGKTFAQAMVARLLGQRTLVLCRTNLIRKAWQDDLAKFFGLGRDDIGIIQQQKYTIGEQFTLSSIATLHRRQHLWNDIFSKFGTVILDELHVLPCNQVYNFVFNCPTAYVLGATATEKRNDGKQFMMYAVFGKPVKRIKAVQAETVSSMPITNVREIKTNFAYRYAQQDLDYQDLLNHMIGDDARNELIVREVLWDWKRGKSVVVTTNRLSHAHLLQEMLIEAGVEDANLLTGSTNQGRTGAVLLEMVNKKDIRCIVATDALISTGANMPPLERLHITVPIVDDLKLTQLLGRLRRKYPGKKSARIRYYKDVRVPYLVGVYKRTAVPVFRSLEIKPYTNLFIS